MKHLLSIFLLATLMQAASIFATRDLGEDLSAFRYNFYPPEPRSSMVFSISPYYNIAYKDQTARGTFWTNPFFFNLNLVLPFQSMFRFSLIPYFDQNFDIYTKIYTIGEYQFQRHTLSLGSINEASLTLVKIWGKKVLTGASFIPLFGSSQEFWEFHLLNSGYTVTDTVIYQYTGIKYGGSLGYSGDHLMINSYAEIGPDLNLKYTTTQRTERDKIGQPHRYGLITVFPLKTNRGIMQVERSIWSEEDQNSPIRFKIGFITQKNSIYYAFNPWYIKGVNEHNLTFTRIFPIPKFGALITSMLFSVKSRNELYEFSLNPTLHLKFDEIFGLRRK